MRCRSSRNLRRGRRLTGSLEGVADGRGIPAPAALRGGDAVGVESVGDRGQALAGCSLGPDPLDHIGGHRWRPAEPDALGTRAGEHLPRALRDRALLAGREGREQARARLARGPRRLERALERNQRPAVLLRAREQAGELGQRGREPPALRGDQRRARSARAAASRGACRLPRAPAAGSWNSGFLSRGGLRFPPRTQCLRSRSQGCRDLRVALWT